MTAVLPSLRDATDVHPFLGGPDLVQRLRPITVTWKQGGMRKVGLARSRGAGRARRTGVAATASGVVINTLPDFPSRVVRDARVILSTPSQSPVTAGISIGGVIASGVSSSVVVMSNSTGTSLSCHAGAVSWQLSRSAF